MLRQKTQEKVSFLDDKYHRELLKSVSCQVIHQLDYMIHSDNQDLHHDDFDPSKALDYSRTVSVSARGSAEFFIYLTRETRNNVTLRLDHYESIPYFTILHHTENFVLQEYSVSFSSFPEGSNGSYTLTFPKEIDGTDCLLCVRLENPNSWIRALTIEYTVEFLLGT